MLSVHAPVALGLVVACVAFSLIYAGLERADRERRIWPGRLHAVASLAGVSVMFAAILASAALAPRAFQVLNGIAVAGYCLTLLAQGLFVLVLLDAFRRAPDMR